MNQRINCFRVQPLAVLSSVCPSGLTVAPDTGIAALRHDIITAINTTDTDRLPEQATGVAAHFAAQWIEVQWISRPTSASSTYNIIPKIIMARRSAPVNIILPPQTQRALRRKRWDCSKHKNEPCRTILKYYNPHTKYLAVPSGIYHASLS